MTPLPQCVLAAIPWIDLIPPSIFADTISVEPVSSGFSRNQVWKISCGNGEGTQRFALRRWVSESHSKKRLTEIIGFQRLAFQKQSVVPEPLRWKNGDSVLESDQALWTVETWLDGAPLPSTSALTQDCLHDLLHQIAQLHDIGRSYAHRYGPATGVSERIDRIQFWIDQRNRDQIQVQLARLAMDSKSREILVRGTLTAIQTIERHSSRWLEQLHSIQQQNILSHMVVRDLWRENILIKDNRISGIIDFGAARIDWPVLEMVRCLSSYLSPEALATSTSLDDYRRLVSDSHWFPDNETILALDRIATSLSLLQWSQWIVEETNPLHSSKSDSILQRFQNLSSRLSPSFNA